MLNRKELAKEPGIFYNDPRNQKTLHYLKNTFPEENITEKLTRLHWKESKSLREIGRIFHIKGTTVKRYMILFNIYIRPYPDPERKASIRKPKQNLTREEINNQNRKRMLLFWSDPENRKKMLIMIRKDENRNRQIKLMLGRWNNPVIRQEITASINSPQAKEKKEKKIRENSLYRIKVKLGENPKAKLEQMYCIDKIYICDIYKQLNIASSTLYKWLKIFEIPKRKIDCTKRVRRPKINPINYNIVMQALKNGSFQSLTDKQKKILMLRYLNKDNPITLAQIGKELDGITRQAIQLCETRAIVKLQTLIK